MDYNLVNGGLIAKAGSEWLISDLKTCRTRQRGEIDGMLWFMNVDEGFVYASDQRRKHALVRVGLDHGDINVLLDQPCYGVMLEKEREQLYFLNENDGKLYRCSTDGKELERLTSDSIRGFVMEEEYLYLATDHGIYVGNRDGGHRERISECVTTSMAFAEGTLALADRTKQHRLTLIDARSGRSEGLDEFAPSSLATDGRYLYCANRVSRRSVYRIDPIRLSSIRISGDGADYLHVIDNDLYFCSNREWQRLSLAGGQPVSVTG